MSSEDETVTRRYMLQTIGAVGAAGLAGCSGSDNSTSSPDSSSSGSDPESETDSEPVEDEEPDYSLPESEHADITEMATNWMIMGDDHGQKLQAVAYSPSKFSEIHEGSFAENALRGGVESYTPFEFSHEDVPESYVQEAFTPWASWYKVDQLPNNVSDEDISEQLLNSGFEKVDERGDFEVYTDGTTPHAVGEGRHVVVLPGMGASESDAEGLMDRVLKEANEDAYEVPDAIQDGLNALDVRDSLTIENTLQDLGYTASTQSNSLQPDYGLSSADFEDGSKYGAWPFESESDAEKAADILSRRDELMNDYENVGRKGNVVTASGPDYDIENMNKDVDMRFFLPMI